MTDEQPGPGVTKQRSCLRAGCMSALVLFVLVVAWVASSFVTWTHCTIRLPDGSGSVTYMARLNKIPCAEWERKVRVDTNRVNGVVSCVPFDTCGAWPVNVYWYPAAGHRGAYLRFHDPLNEYLVDLECGKTLLVVRTRGYAYVGDISQHSFIGWEASGPVSADGKASGSAVEVTVNDRPARRLELSVASSKGQYLGRIEHPRRRFISSEEAPEKVLPQR